MWYQLYVGHFSYLNYFNRLLYLAIYFSMVRSDLNIYYLLLPSAPSHTDSGWRTSSLKVYLYKIYVSNNHSNIAYSSYYLAILCLPDKYWEAFDAYANMCQLQLTYLFQVLCAVLLTGTVICLPWPSEWVNYKEISAVTLILFNSA